MYMNISEDCSCGKVHEVVYYLGHRLAGVGAVRRLAALSYAKLRLFPLWNYPSPSCAAILGHCTTCGSCLSCISIVRSYNSRFQLCIQPRELWCQLCSNNLRNPLFRSEM